MNKHLSRNGTCLCGAVRMSTTIMSPRFAACHCEMCRKWGGGPFMAVECGQDVKIEGEDSVAVYNSSEWAERGFCKSCGTHLFYRLKGTKEYQIPIGFLEGTESLKFGLQVFIDKKPENYSFSNKTREMTKAQIYEMYAPKE